MSVYFVCGCVLAFVSVQTGVCERDPVGDRCMQNSCCGVVKGEVVKLRSV